MPPAVHEMITGEAAAAAGPEKHTCKPSIDVLATSSLVDLRVIYSGAGILHFKVPVLGLMTSIEPSLWPMAAVAVAVSERPFRLPMEIL